MWARIQMPTEARSCMAKGVISPMPAILIGVVFGRIPKQLEDSVHNWLHLIPAPSHSENAGAHWLLNWCQWSIRKVVPASLVITDPILLLLHIRLGNMNSPHSSISHSKLVMRMHDYGWAPSTKPNNCVWVIMENFNSLGVFTKGTKINSLNKLCHQFNTDILAGCET